MGSSQSINTPPSPPDGPSPQQPDSSHSFHDADQHLSGMDLVNFKCAKKKTRYERCTANFYKNEFLTGRSLSQAEACQDKFDAYRACVLKGIKVEIWDKQGLPPLKEGSPLLEVDEDSV